MKKIICFAMTFVLTLGCITVYALNEQIAQKFMDQKGFTESDIKEIDAIMALSGENVPAFIATKYEELKDWKKVREAYKISEDDYAQYLEEQKHLEEVLNIPQYIYDEMKEAGLSQYEQREIIFRANVNDIDIEYAWAQCKTGKTIQEVAQEKLDKEQEEADILGDFVYGKITEEEYMTALNLTKDANTRISDILNYAISARKKVRDRHIKNSNITEEEIEYCIKQGMTEVMDMCQAKYISTGNNIEFSEVVAARLRNDDWIATVADVLNIPLEEYKKSVEDARNN